MKKRSASVLPDLPQDDSDNLAPRLPTSRRVLSRKGRQRDRDFFTLLTVVQAIVTVAATSFELLSEMAFDACGERGPASVCNYAIADALFPIELVSMAVIAVATVVWAIRRSRRGKRIWWLPLAEMGASLAVSVTLVLIVYKMINLSPFAA